MSKKPTRWEQIGALMTAMVAVIVSGQSDLLLAHAETVAPIDGRAARCPAFPRRQLNEFKTGGKYHGIYARVARERGIKTATVWNAANGYHHAPHLVAAVRAEMARVDEKLGVDLPETIEPASPISAPEAAAFKRGGRYSGLCAIVGNRLDKSRECVYASVFRPRPSQPVLRALRAEMGRVDAELAAKGGAK